MTAVPANPETDPGQILHDLLVREAHLKLGRAQIKPLWEQREAELRALEARRPSLLAWLSPAKREDRAAELAAARERVEVLRRRLDLLDRCEPHIKRQIEDAIEVLLRDSCPEYVQALAARRQKEDWLRCLERFGGKIYEFTRSLGNVRNLACSGYNRETKLYSAGAIQGFQLAVEAAEHVQNEVRFANKIADAQLALFQKSGVETKPLPRLVETNYATWVAKIRTLPLAEAQIEFDTLITSTKKLHEAGIPELKDQADRVQFEQDSDIRNFLLRAWEQFRGEIAPQIFPGDTERIVLETGEWLESIARSSVTGRL